MTGDEVPPLLDAVCTWARGQVEIQGILLVGSHARGQAGSSSDVDLVMITDQAQTLIDDRSWLEIFGDVEHQRVEDWGALRSLRVRFQGGPEVEFGLTAAEWAFAPLDLGTLAVIQDGFRVLLEKGGVFQHLREASPGSEYS